MNDSQSATLLTKVFFNDENKLRSGWRFFVFLSVFVLAAMTIGAVLTSLVAASGIGSGDNSLLQRVGGSIISLALALFVGWLCARFLEDLPFRSLGAWFTNNWLKDLVLGVVFGAGAIGLAALIAVVFGGLRFEFNASAGSSAILLTLAATLVVFTFGAAFEEAFVRGYMFQTFTRSGLAWLAILLTSLIFAAGHLGNQGATVFSTANTALAGVWLGVGYLKTRTLWFVTGVHFAWNWCQGSVLGVEVSGFDTFATAPLFLEVDGGPIWITGGGYGLEGGFAGTIALVISTVLIWYSPFLKADTEMAMLTSPVPRTENNKPDEVLT